MSKLVINKQRALLVHSEASKRYAEFYDLLRGGTTITDINIGSFNEETQTVVRYMLYRLIEEARSEWVREVKYKEYPKSAGMKCSICGKKQILYVYFINNAITGEQLQVGRECVKQFVDTKYIKLAERNNRAYELNVQFPGIERTMSEWNNRILREIVIPRHIEVPYSKILTSLRGICNKFLDGNLVEGSYERTYEAIDNLLKSGQEILLQVNDYVAKNRNIDWVATRKIYDWLLSYHETKTINRIKDTGFVTEETAGRIAEDEFMVWVCNRVNKLINDKELILAPVAQKRAYQFSMKPLPQALLKVDHISLFRNVGNQIFCKAEITWEDIANMSAPFNDSAYEQVLQEIANQLRRTGLHYYGSDLQFNEAIFNNPQTSIYYKVAFRNFVDTFVTNIFSKKTNPDSINTYLVQHAARFNKEDADEKINLWLGKI